CKHALGLLLLLSDGEVPAAACPDWVAEWLAARTQRQAKKTVAPDSAAVWAGPPAHSTPAASPGRKERRGGGRTRRRRREPWRAEGWPGRRLRHGSGGTRLRAG